MRRVLPLLLVLFFATAASAATIKGTKHNDRLTGTAKADTISGGLGNDTIRGLAGNDRLNGGPGADRLDGGPGNDTIVGGPGRDRIVCGAGSDSVLADPGDTVAADCEKVKGGPPKPPPPPSPDTNLALGKPFTASSSTTADFPASKAGDGDPDSYWESQNNAFPQWIQVDLVAPQSVAKLVLKLPPATAWNARTQTIEVAASTDGTTFTTLVPATGYVFDPAASNTVTIALPATKAQAIRLTFSANTVWPAAQLSELELYAT